MVRRVVLICVLIGAGIIAILALFMVRPCSLCEKNDAETISAVEINDVVFQVDVADTESERVAGLSGRQFLLEHTGMLFIFEKSHIQSFWMKDMNFPIDIVWIDEEKKIVGIQRYVSPETYPQSFVSPQPIMYVLEVGAGMSSSMNIGDMVNFIKSS